MAIDSRAKRTSAAGLPFMPLYPEPDGVISLSDRMMMAGIPTTPGYVSADSHDSSSESGWDNPEYAYDDNPATYATEKVIDSESWLTLEWSPVHRIDGWRILAKDVDYEAAESSPDAIVELYEGGVWGYTKDISNLAVQDVWYEYDSVTFEGSRISKARIKSAGAQNYLYVAGFQVRSLGQFYPAAARPLASGGMNANPLIKGGLVR